LGAASAVEFPYFFFCLDGLGHLTCSLSELILNLTRQLVRFLGWGTSPVARPILAQDNTNTELMQTDVHASRGIRRYDLIV
jgi:hypothetical protein